MAEKKLYYLQLFVCLADMFLSMGGLFKIIYWPIAKILIVSGALILMLGFMLLHSIGSYRLAEENYLRS
jgi:hypothetical protein|tara:strand:- start:1674 stop:1880 length:207 start_codon:yes stop_codon:yes gene_type:complete